jgi:hypothetical protein
MAHDLGKPHTGHRPDPSAPLAGIPTSPPQWPSLISRRSSSAPHQPSPRGPSPTGLVRVADHKPAWVRQGCPKVRRLPWFASGLRSARPRAVCALALERPRCPRPVGRRHVGRSDPQPRWHCLERRAMRLPLPQVSAGHLGLGILCDSEVAYIDVRPASYHGQYGIDAGGGMGTCLPVHCAAAGEAPVASLLAAVQRGVDRIARSGMLPWSAGIGSPVATNPDGAGGCWRVAFPTAARQQPTPWASDTHAGTTIDTQRALLTMAS